MPNRFRLYYLSKPKDALLAKWIRYRKSESESNPIFILSSGRSGSTLLSSVLNTHKSVFIPKENNLLLSTIKHWYWNLGEPWNVHVESLERRVKATHDWPIAMEKLIKALLKKKPTEQNLDGLCNELFHYSAKEHSKSAVVWGDQAPANAPYINSLKAQFPRSRIIFLVRDPRAVCASYFKINPEYYTEKFVVWRWKSAIKNYESIAQMHPETIRMVKYEELVSNFDQVISDLLFWLKLDPQRMDLNKRNELNKIIIDNKSDAHANVFNAINTGSLRKWKRELSEDQIRRIEKKLGSLMEMYF